MKERFPPRNAPPEPVMSALIQTRLWICPQKLRQVFSCRQMQSKMHKRNCCYRHSSPLLRNFSRISNQFMQIRNGLFSRLVLPLALSGKAINDQDSFQVSHLPSTIAFYSTSYTLLNNSSIAICQFSASFFLICKRRCTNQ